MVQIVFCVKTKGGTFIRMFEVSLLTLFLTARMLIARICSSFVWQLRFRFCDQTLVQLLLDYGGGLGIILGRFPFLYFGIDNACLKPLPNLFIANSTVQISWASYYYDGARMRIGEIFFESRNNVQAKFIVTAYSAARIRWAKVSKRSGSFLPGVDQNGCRGKIFVRWLAILWLAGRAVLLSPVD